VRNRRTPTQRERGCRRTGESHWNQGLREPARRVLRVQCSSRTLASQNSSFFAVFYRYGCTEDSCRTACTKSRAPRSFFERRLTNRQRDGRRPQEYRSRLWRRVSALAIPSERKFSGRKIPRGSNWNEGERFIESAFACRDLSSRRSPAHVSDRGIGVASRSVPNPGDGRCETGGFGSAGIIRASARF